MRPASTPPVGTPPPSRRRFLEQALALALSYHLLGLVVRNRALAEPVRTEIETWVRRMDSLARDLDTHALSPSAWQTEIESLMMRVDLSDLLDAIEFERIETALRYPDLGVATRPVRFPGFEPYPNGLRFVTKVFGMNADRAVIPHGHRNMASAHLVLSGQVHLRQYERVEDEPGALIVRPTVDAHVGPGHASSISDERNNVHWLIARGGRAHTLDTIVLGIDDDAPVYEIDNVDAENAESIGGDLLRMPILSVTEALSRYGHDHHG